MNSYIADYLIDNHGFEKVEGQPGHMKTGSKSVSLKYGPHSTTWLAPSDEMVEEIAALHTGIPLEELRQVYINTLLENVAFIESQVTSTDEST
jgi:hypothetical protein